MTILPSGLISFNPENLAYLFLENQYKLLWLFCFSFLPFSGFRLRKERSEKMRKCELCKGIARMYCESDEASLCWDCDEKVHRANFLVAKHQRCLLCHVCQSITPWKASGQKLAPTVSVCETCVSSVRCKVHDDEEVVKRENQSERSNNEDEDEDLDESDEYDEESDDDEEEEEEEEEEQEEDGDNQVVPWSVGSQSPPPPPPVSCSSSSSLSSGEEISMKRMRSFPDLYSDVRIV